jgi:hypothetical protein
LNISFLPVIDETWTGKRSKPEFALIIAMISIDKHGSEELKRFLDHVQMITNWGVGDRGEFCYFRSHKGFPNVNSQLEMPMIIRLNPTMAGGVIVHEEARFAINASLPPYCNTS